MKQLTQKLKDGKMQILEVPIPFQQRGHILVRNHYSLISAGTEASTVKAARKGYIGKAKERPQQVKQVFDTLKAQGVTQTYRAVMKKLDAYSPLGYSCAGEVLEVASDVKEFAVGDLVACGGFTANHSEVVSVPVNLCVKLGEDADLRHATYNTLGAIAMQGVRQADLRLGETCVVIGLGLLGQLTGLLLKASGVKVAGIDIDANSVDIGRAHCLDLGLNRQEGGIEERILRFTDGLGSDAVIITAASDSLDPINLAGALSRQKGTIIIVGAVPTGFDREPHFYKKELQLKMSCSYGPGRYDPAYEEKGIDYPPAYVRWTEKRNMQAFQELIYQNKINLDYLTTHCFKLDVAPDAYNMIMDKSEPFTGILIEYDVTRPVQRGKIAPARQASAEPQAVSIGFIGAGSYAQSHLLPNIPKNGNVSLTGVMTITGTSSRSVLDRYGFDFCTSDESDILANEEINTVFVASRHDSHAELALAALKAGKNVFVEKPLCLSEEELLEIADCYRTGAEKTDTPLSLMVGYNRRFSKLVEKIKREFGNGPMAMNYRVNAGKIPAGSWIQDIEAGGGRIIGEVCHFVDLLTFINGSSPTSVYATRMSDPQHLDDVVNISLSYQNGSIGNIAYFSNGDKSVPKERVEVFANGCTAILEDFKSLTIHRNGKKNEAKLLSQDKGQKAEVRRFIESVLEGAGPPIPFAEVFSASLTTFKILDSIRTGQSIKY